METTEFELIPFAKYSLVGVLAGIFAVIVSYIFYFSFNSGQVAASASGLLNPGTIIYGCLIPATMGGMLYFGLDKIKGGIFIYILICSAIMIFLVKESLNVQSSNDPVTEKLFHQLFTVLIGIPGIFTTIGVPVFIKNKKLTSAFL